MIGLTACSQKENALAFVRRGGYCRLRLNFLPAEPSTLKHRLKAELLATF
jgi:hypothetical protein